MIENNYTMFFNNSADAGVTVSGQFFECIDEINGNLNVDCLIQKSVYQYHNMILYVLVIAYLLLIFYPLLKFYFVDRLGFEISITDVCQVLLLFCCLTVIYLNGFLGKIGMVILFVVIYVFEYGLSKIYKKMGLE